MSGETKMYTCHVCGKPTPNYHEWWPSMAAILGEQGSSTCDECSRKAQISYKWRNEQFEEVWVDPDHRVDFVAFSPGSGGRNAALEQGRFVFVEVKSCMADFKSGHGLTFHGDQNWLVCPRDLAHKLYDERLLPFGVQVYCPDGGGALRLTYDLQMQAAKSLREDSTLCLLWAMLMGSYSRWRTTGDVFYETSD